MSDPTGVTPDPAAAQAAADEETEDFLDRLEAEAEVAKYDYMHSRVPSHRMKAFLARNPMSGPDMPTIAFKARYPDGGPPQLEQGYISNQAAARPSDIPASPTPDQVPADLTGRSLGPAGTVGATGGYVTGRSLGPAGTVGATGGYVTGATGPTGPTGP